MKRKQIDMYKFFKNEYTGALIFFRVKDRFVTLFDDAEEIAGFLGRQLDEGGQSFSFPCGDLETMSRVGDLSKAVEFVSVRNADEEFDFPNISLIQEQREIDY